MKGLLLKDWYMTVKYCRAYLLIAIVFIAVSFAGDGNLFFTFYPCLLCGMIPVNLLAYDERSRWIQYSETLPYSGAQIVSSKYLIGLFAQITMLLVTSITQGLHMRIGDTFRFDEFAMLMLLMLIICTLSSSICLPFVFKLGVEKGRIAYYLMVGMVCAGSVIASSVFRGGLEMEVRPNAVLAIVAAAGIALYALSWYLSVKFYQAREL